MPTLAEVRELAAAAHCAPQHAEVVRALREELQKEQSAHHVTRQRLEMCEHRARGGGGGGGGDVPRVINSEFWTEAEAFAAYAEFQGCFEEVVVALFDVPGYDAAEAVQRESRRALGAATAYFEEAYRDERARLQALPELRDVGAVSRAMRSGFCLVATDPRVAACVERCVEVLPAALTAALVAKLFRHDKWVRLWLSMQCWLALNLEDRVDVEALLSSGRERFDAARHRKCGLPDDCLCVVVIPPLKVAGKLVVAGVVCT